MSDFLAVAVAGIATYGCIYAITAMGLVVTYKVSGVFNFAQGAIGMLAAFLYWQLTRVGGGRSHSPSSSSPSWSPHSWGRCSKSA